jgi:LPLT family lysophospholipid transporter-like MFS transporter
MNHPQILNLSLWSRGMLAVLLAQFLSAMADNAVLIVAIAIVKNHGLTQMVPFLQEAFVLPFILLAPFVGQVADGFSKGTVMLWANFMKLVGAVLMACGVNPFIAYNLIGIGATIYSPAKYGILSQMFDPEQLVRANGMLEGSTIAAILVGVLLGGWLADHSLVWAFGGVMGAYALAAVANLGIPRLPAENSVARFAPRLLVQRFTGSVRLFIADADARFSLLGTSVFWASGTTLRLLLFVWVPVALATTDNQTPAILMGVLSIGIVLGAAAASFWISLANVNWALVGGLMLSPVILAMSSVGSLSTAGLLMGVMGVCGGVFVVPLNALLQKRGHDSIGAGSALAIQNFFENCAILIFVGGYSLASSAGVSVDQILVTFSAVVAVAVLGLALSRCKLGG